MSIGKEIRKIKILHKYLENCDLPTQKLANLVGEIKNTVYDVIKRFGEGLSTERKPGSGGERKVSNQLDQ